MRSWIPLISDFAGGLDKLASRFNAITGQYQRGEDVNTAQFPFARVFLGAYTKYADRDANNQVVDEVRIAKNVLKILASEGNS